MPFSWLFLEFKFDFPVGIEEKHHVRFTILKRWRTVRIEVDGRTVHRNILEFFFSLVLVLFELCVIIVLIILTLVLPTIYPQFGISLQLFVLIILIIFVFFSNPLFWVIKYNLFKKRSFKLIVGEKERYKIEILMITPNQRFRGLREYTVIVDNQQIETFSERALPVVFTTHQVD